MMEKKETNRLFVEGNIEYEMIQISEHLSVYVEEKRERQVWSGWQEDYFEDTVAYIVAA